MDPLRLQASLGFALRPLAVIYRLIAGLRRKSWETGLMNRLNPVCPCVSVGNIAWGGTGKTPITGWLMDWALEHGARPVVLSRGYKADLSIAPVYVKPHHTAREVGDEPLMLALEHPGGIVLVDPNRRRAGRYALRSLSPGMFILDDGFQHLPVRRDLDLVLLRPVDLTSEWNRIIPAGSWRESAAALTRASAFLFKIDKDGLERLLPNLRTRLRAFERPIFSFTLEPVSLDPVSPRVSGSPETLREKPYALLAAVGDPRQVRDTVTRFLGHPPDRELIFPDHYSYTFRDADRIAKYGLPVVCTRKDAVKLRHLPLENVWALRVEVRFGPALWSSLTFPQWIDAWWERQNRPAVELLGAPPVRWTGFTPGRDALWEPARHVEPPLPDQPQAASQAHSEAYMPEENAGPDAPEAGLCVTLHATPDQESAQEEPVQGTSVIPALFGGEADDEAFRPETSSPCEGPLPDTDAGDRPPSPNL